MGHCNLCFNLWVVLVHLKLENHGHRVCNIIEGAFREISGYPSRERSEQAEKNRKNLTKLTRPQGGLRKGGKLMYYPPGLPFLSCGADSLGPGF